MLFFFVACSSTAELEKDSPVPPVDSSTPAAADSAPLYDPSVLHEVAITLDPDDWDSLRWQTRSIVSLLDDECLAEPWDGPYTYFSAQVSFDGESMGTVGIRKKGLLGSASPTRPSLRVDVDHEVDGQTFHGLGKFVFNNNNQDLSRMHTCLAHAFNRDAGLVAPRCSLAHVTVNGEDLGIYDNTEAVDEDLIARDVGTPPTTLYEGTLSDFRTDWLGTFDPKNDASDKADLQAVTDALLGDDDSLLAALDPLVDLPSFYTFWAAEALSGQWDGYTSNTNNFYVYRDGVDDKLHFIVSGPDATFDSRTPFSPVWVTTVGALPNRLIQLPEAKAAYVAEMERLLDDVWDADTRIAQVQAWEDLVHDDVTGAERAAANDLEDVLAAKDADVRADLGGDVTVPDLRPYPCLSEVGDAHVEFTTTWGSYPDGDLVSGGLATTSYSLNGTDYPSTLDGVSIGAADESTTVWLTISTIAANTYLAPYITIIPPTVASGDDISLDDGGVWGQLLYNGPDTGGQWYTAAYLGHGTLHLDTASMGDGDTVSGTLDAKVLGGT